MSASKKVIVDFYTELKRHKIALISAILFFICVIASLFVTFIAPYDVYDLSNLDIMDSELPPIWMEEGDQRFLLGTEIQGRDMLSAILYGLRTSLIIGVFAVLLQMFIGVVLGVLSGYFGGFIDSFLMRIADLQLSFSTLMIAIIVSAVFQSTLGSQLYSQYALIMLVLIIGIAEWPQYARVVRSCVLAEKKKEYVESAKIMGLKPFRIMFVEILPNCLSSLIVLSTLQVANAIMSEAMLSFLGLGMPTDKPSLGSLIKIGFEYIFSGTWWITVFPGILLVLLILVINILGDFFRDYLNPKFIK